MIEKYDFESIMNSLFQKVMDAETISLIDLMMTKNHPTGYLLIGNKKTSLKEVI